MTDFWQRLKQRKLVQWAVAYVAGAWAVLQVLDLAADSYHWPDVVMHLAFGVIALGLVVALLLAWYHGERGQQRVTGIELLLLAGVFAIGGFMIWHYAGRASSPAAIASTAAPVTVGSGAAPTPAPQGSVPAKSIAVLPFENLSTDKANGYFASGMQDLILTKLAGIGDLKVISRTSTAKYKSRPDDLKTVARQLGVATVLEGSVQKAGEQVLINVQLIDAKTDHHLWAQSYQRKIDNIFGVEGEVAQKVADALKAKLTPAETTQVAQAPTRNAAAFDAFLKAEEQARKAYASQSKAAFLSADADYLQAIALDPDFALAYARLAYDQIQRHWIVAPLTAAQLATTKAYIDRALALAPDLPQAHLALGYYDYYGFRRYAAATTEFQRTLALAPNDARALAGLAFVARRTGQVAQALNYLKQVVAISPRDPFLLTGYGETLMLVRRYAQANAEVQRALILSPDDANTYDILLPIQLFGFGDTHATRQAVKSLPGWRIGNANVLAGDLFVLANTRTYADVFARRFDTALHAWDSAPTATEEQRLTGQAARIAISLLAGRHAQVRPECERLAPVLRAALAKSPKSLWLLQQVSWVDVCLGRNAEAIALARRAVAVMPLSKDSYFGTFQLVGQAQIAAWADAPDLALKTIRQLMDMPAGAVMSIERLKRDPVFDPLRKDPRFQALLKKYARQPTIK